MSKELYEKIASLPPKRLALLALELQAELDAQKRARAEPIAIVGAGCRTPGGAGSPEALWELLHDGVDAITEVPRDRWDAGALYDPDPDRAGRTYARWGGFLGAVDAFDAAFFGIAPREVAAMDPQHRLLLEVAWEALERAGQPPDRLTGTRTGVFLGIIGSDYARLQAAERGEALDIYYLTGTCLNAAAGRLSYTFGLQGPSVAIDTACSSSLVALHLACQSLRGRECDLALAAGVNLVLTPDGTIALSSSRGLAPDGRCKTFDAGADGFVRSEGCIVLVLKRLSDAVAAGDPVLALVVGSAVNQDGASSGLMVPNGPAQELVLRQALASAGLSPQAVSFVEAHGTGTSLGDPIELGALARVLGEGRTEEAPLVVGSLKSNLGHLEAAAGLAGVLKVALALDREAIPPNLHFRRLNPSIELGGVPLLVPTAPRPWPRREPPRVAGVSAFGLSGTNAHVLLQEAPPDASTPAPARGAELLVLSARSPEALRATAERHAAWLAAHPDVALRDTCFTAAARRAHHDHRLATVGRTHEALAERLSAFARGEAAPALSSGRRPSARRRIAFVFPGQGSQWLGMGRQLLEQEPSFRDALALCDRAVQAEAGFSVLDELAAGADRSRLHEIDVIQPVLFAIEVALAALWRAWGIEPDAVVGHSMGEVAAAHVAGALSLEDAAAIICRRSRLIRTVSGRGAMLLVDLTLAEAEQALRGLEDRVSVAVSNGVRSTVLSGDPAALERIAGDLGRRDVFCRFVKVDVASHSPQMDPLRPALLDALRGVSPRPGSIPICSTVTGTMTDGAGFGAAYWADNLRAPVLFSTAIERLAAEGGATFIEISPHPILLPSIEQHLRHTGREGGAIPSLRRDEDERAAMLSGLGAVYALGHKVDLGLQHLERGRCVDLPTYPWQRERFWVDALSRGRRPRPREGHPLLGAHVALATRSDAHVWQTELTSDSPAYLADHRVHGGVVLPGAAYLEMALAGAAEALGRPAFALEDVVFLAILALPDGEPLEVQTAIAPDEARGFRFSIHSRAAAHGRAASGARFTLHAEGILRAEPDPAGAADAFPLEEARARCAARVEGDAHYEVMQQRGVAFGPSFRALKELWRRDGEAIARVELPPAVAAELSAYQVHPALLDACFQVLNGAGLREAQGETFVPIALERLRVHGRPDRARWGHAIVRRRPGDAEGTLEGDVTLLDEEGAVLLEARGLACRRLAASPRRVADEIDGWMYGVAWEEAPRAGAGPAAGAAPAGGAAAGAWLILADRGGFGRKLHAALRERGEACVVATPGQAHRQVEPGRHEIDPRTPGGLASILEAEFGPGRPPCRGVVHLFSLDAARPEDDLAALADAQRLGVESALHVAQALAQAGSRDVPRLFLATAGVHAAAPGERARHVAQAPLWGLGRVIALEHAELRCCNVDLGALDEAEALSLADELLASTPEDQIALRGGARFVARLARLRAPAVSPAALRPDGTYLVTGGLGGIGLELAAWLVERGARHLVLLGRSGASAEAQRAIDALSARGAQIHVRKADVAERPALERVLAEIEAGMPPLRGVVHAAAVLDDGVILNLSVERLRAVMAPKVLGAWNLHALTAGAPLDFFLLFSAAGALMGSPGQGNYAAANAFLDALAPYRRGLGLPALSVDWGAWAEVGLAAASAIRGERIALRGVGSMRPAEALEALGRLLDGPEARVAVMRFDLRQWGEFYLTAARSPFLERLAREQAERGARPADQGAFVAALAAAEIPARPRMLEVHLREQLGHVLRLSPSRIDPEAPLGGMGLDSLMSLELRNRLEASLGLRLPATLAFRYPTVAALVGRLAELLDLPVAAPAAPPADDAAALDTVLVESVKQLSEEEAEALLAERLAALDQEI
ncbi:type I polyketide synthase [Sorangium sp. So ce388]|uniref:type I polyketide synthase n=1 Tax=Sorangium sp. So ce388 TaxID=3133309 RepID=UPI003F5B3AFB